MSVFEILEIGEDVEATEGLPDGCDLCGHCIMLRQTLAAGSMLPCGGGKARGEAFEELLPTLQAEETTKKEPVKNPSRGEAHR